MEFRKIPLDESLWRYKEPARFEVLSAQQAMELACAVALKGAGAVHKNPMVGAVLVDAEHRFLVASAHLAFGQDHAEVSLLKQIQQLGLSDHLAQSTLYVTLEPCSHHGKTPPCVDAILRVPIRELVYAAIDPNPLVSGRGIRLLEEQGVQCTFSKDFAAMAEYLLEHFSWGLSHKTPYIGLKTASSLNGMAAYPGDQRAWISGERARHYGHWLRCQYEGILVGAQTIVLDNPTLDVRHPHIQARNPLRIVLDPHGRALQVRDLSEHNILKGDASQTLWICEEVFWESLKGQEMVLALQELGAKILSLPKAWTLHSLLCQLGEREMVSLLIEGGPRTWGAFLQAGLVNKMHCFLATKVFAGNAINFAAYHLGSSHLNLKQTVLTMLEDDILVEGIISEDKL